MANKPQLRKFLSKGVPFTLTVTGAEGQRQLSFSLLFDFNALALVEELTGYSLLTGTIFNHLNARISSILFWAAIQAYSPEYAGPDGLDVIRSLMTLKNNEAIQEAVNEAFIQALPDEQAANIRAALAAKAEGGEAPLAKADEKAE